uniref:NB-ARC domain-containing protein n=1 Tax=Quercus lobata TaxID=97700 RepID=A0A7N2N787_QUELO
MENQVDLVFNGCSKSWAQPQLSLITFTIIPQTHLLFLKERETMAEGALFDLAGKVINALGSLIVQEVKLASSVETEIEYLTNTVSTIHTSDDKKVRLFSSSSNLLAFSPKMGHEIKAIRERLNAIAKDKDDFHFSQSLVEPQVMNRSRETYSFVLEDEVIGRENDKKEIMERLFDDNVVENISIVPIVEILEPLPERKHEESLEREILEQLRKHEESLVILQNKLREKLNGKKYSIVLDDLWNEDNSEWLLLRNLLMVGTRGSRILVTTRSESVARIIGAT